MNKNVKKSIFIYSFDIVKLSSWKCFFFKFGTTSWTHTDVFIIQSNLQYLIHPIPQKNTCRKLGILCIILNANHVMQHHENHVIKEHFFFAFSLSCLCVFQPKLGNIFRTDSLRLYTRYSIWKVS